MSARSCYHCRVWAIVGQVVVVACAHCPKVFEDWDAMPGDAERVEQSQTAHQTAPKRLGIPCQRPSDWCPQPQREIA